MTRKPPIDKYERAVKKRAIKEQIINRIAQDLVFLSNHYEFDSEASSLVAACIPWFENRGILKMMEPDPDDNVIDFLDWVQKNSIFDPQE